MIITTNIRMDLSAHAVTPPVEVVQDDKYSRDLLISLYANGTVWEIPSGTTAIVRFAKPDGKGGNYNTMPDGTAAYKISGNTVRIRLAPQVCTTAGLVRLAVGLVNGAVEINTFAIAVNVQRNPGVGVTSEDYNHVAGFVSASGWTPNMYLGTDSNGNVIAVEAPEGTGGSGATAEQLAQIQKNADDIAAHTTQIQANADAIANLPMTVQDGYTYIAGLPLLDHGKVVYDGQNITVTTVWENGETHEDVIHLNESGLPVKLVLDGRETPWEVSGFEDGAESTDTGETEV